MDYKYSYRFVIRGVSFETQKPEFIAEIRQDRNIAIDSQLYKIIKTECHSHFGAYNEIFAAIYLRDNANNECFRYIGMFFFDQYDALTHRAVCITDKLGADRYWGCFNWR